MNRFVAVCQARTGTHLLRTSLEQHPAIRCAWEPFNDKAVQNFSYGLDTPTRRILELVWRDEPGIRAAGFPLHLSHGRDGRAWGDIWQLLADDSALIRIHLYRRNLLDQLISHTLALRTGNWMQEEPATTTTDRAETLRLDVDDCRTWFAATAAAVHAHHHATPEALTLSYEDLATDLNTATARVFDRLGVTPVTVHPKIAKQGQPAERTLENFGQLQEAFMGTPWASFFDPTCQHKWDTAIQQHAGIAAR